MLIVFGFLFNQCWWKTVEALKANIVVCAVTDQCVPKWAQRKENSKIPKRQVCTLSNAEKISFVFQAKRTKKKKSVRKAMNNHMRGVCRSSVSYSSFFIRFCVSSLFFRNGFEWLVFVTIFFRFSTLLYFCSMFVLYLQKRNCMRCRLLQLTEMKRRNTIYTNPLTWSKPIQRWMLESFPHRTAPKLPDLKCAL